MTGTRSRGGIRALGEIRAQIKPYPERAPLPPPKVYEPPRGRLGDGADQSPALAGLYFCGGSVKLSSSFRAAEIRCFIPSVRSLATPCASYSCTVVCFRSNFLQHLAEDVSR